MNKPYCNNCLKYTGITVKEQKHPRGIEETYFNCEHCYHHYTVSVTNKRARKLSRKMKQEGIRYMRDDTMSIATVDGGEDTIHKSKEQTELDTIMNTLGHNLVQYGVADL